MIASSSAARRHWLHDLLGCLLVAALTAGSPARADSDPRAAGLAADPVDLDTPHARLEIRFTPDRPGSTAGLLVEGRFTLKHRSIPVSDYAGFASVVERALSAGQLTFLLH